MESRHKKRQIFRIAELKLDRRRGKCSSHT